MIIIFLSLHCGACSRSLAHLLFLSTALTCYDLGLAAETCLEHGEVLVIKGKAYTLSLESLRLVSGRTRLDLRDRAGHDIGVFRPALQANMGASGGSICVDYRSSD